jgi:hypothetical protein
MAHELVRGSGDRRGALRRGRSRFRRFRPQNGTLPLVSRRDTSPGVGQTGAVAGGHDGDEPCPVAIGFLPQCIV